ncbi:unnamed protein product [Parnassius apollo]|uniref:(apollo) hypothetical protein n=1 Tax=Parnassius apollo TaxID=110799 RepID=A0A8S3WZ23_PARAO|nr:unnamed protein product [Parnassius apollo]
MFRNAVPTRYTIKVDVTNIEGAERENFVIKQQNMEDVKITENEHHVDDVVMERPSTFTTVTCNIMNSNETLSATEYAQKSYQEVLFQAAKSVGEEVENGALLFVKNKESKNKSGKCVTNS